MDENIDNLLKFADMIIEEKGEYKAMRILRGIAPRFFSGYPNTKKVKTLLTTTLTTKQSLIDILNDFKEGKLTNL